MTERQERSARPPRPAPARRRAVRNAPPAAAALTPAGTAWIGVTELLAAQKDLATLRQSVTPAPTPGAASGAPRETALERATRSAAAHAVRSARPAEQRLLEARPLSGSPPYRARPGDNRLLVSCGRSLVTPLRATVKPGSACRV
jgi:hypothetical protein